MSWRRGRNDSERGIKLSVAEVALDPSPIHPNWVLEGSPVARNNVLSRSSDGTATTFLWDCTAGRFNWFYDIDETVYVIEGGVVVKDAAGVTRRLKAGDTFYFPAGAHAEWHVENYVRKIAFCRAPLPRVLVFAKRVFRFLRRLTDNGRSADARTAMSHNN
jgi:uncharacterized cupin superfamily protein